MAPNRFRVLLPKTLVKAGWDIIKQRDDVDAIAYPPSIAAAEFHGLLGDADGVALSLTRFGGPAGEDERRQRSGLTPSPYRSASVGSLRGARRTVTEDAATPVTAKRTQVRASASLSTRVGPLIALRSE